MLRRLLSNHALWLAGILLVAAFLRFYDLSGYLQFLGDQGRDALVVKGMTEGKWTLLGPNASVGGFFTGPIYYYFMLPLLWLFQLDPVGPAVLSALFGVATVALIYWTGKEFFGRPAGLLAAFLLAISPKMLEISRFSWNPNPVPFFALLAVVLLYLAAKKGKARFAFLAGLSLGVLVQLHYMCLAFAAVMGGAIVLLFPRKQLGCYLLAALAGFLLGDSLFLIFELRHGFPNSASVWEFVTRGGNTVAPRSANILWLVWEVLRRLYGMTLAVRDTVGEPLLLVPSLAAIGLWLMRRPEKTAAILLLAWLIGGALGIGFYKGQLHDHYFGYLYPLPFLLLGSAGSFLWGRRKWWLVLPILAGVTAVLVRGWYLWQPPNNMLSQIQEIDRIILSYAQGQPYNLALISGYNSDHAYRYYLELWKRPPVVIENPAKDPERKTVTDQLMVICEERRCEPLGHPLWEIAGFGRAEIAGEKMGPAGIRVFKLVHYKG